MTIWCQAKVWKKKPYANQFRNCIKELYDYLADRYETADRFKALSGVRASFVNGILGGIKKWKGPKLGNANGRNVPFDFGERGSMMSMADYNLP